MTPWSLNLLRAANYYRGDVTLIQRMGKSSGQQQKILQQNLHHYSSANSLE
jgi:hypothetical protein